MCVCVYHTSSIFQTLISLFTFSTFTSQPPLPHSYSHSQPPSIHLTVDATHSPPPLSPWITDLDVSFYPLSFFSSSFLCFVFSLIAKIIRIFVLWTCIIMFVVEKQINNIFFSKITWVFLLCLCFFSFHDFFFFLLSSDYCEPIIFFVFLETYLLFFLMFSITRISLSNVIFEKWKFNVCITHPWRFRPPIYKLPIQS